MCFSVRLFDVSNVVDNHNAVLVPPRHFTHEIEFVFGFLELLYERRGGHELDAHATLNQFVAQRGGKVRFSHTAGSNQQHVVTAMRPIHVFAQTPYDSLYLKNPVYKNLTAMFALSKMKSADVVFLGNSITFGGNWTELLGRERIANRGIGGDNTVGMLNRMQYVYQLKPKLCFVMAGINDIYDDAPVEKIFANYTSIIDTLQAHSIIPIIQSTLHVNPKWKHAEEKNPEVEKLNLLLQKYARKHSIEFIDLNAALSSNDILRDEYTTDGVHLNASAYAVWRDMLEPILRTGTGRATSGIRN